MKKLIVMIILVATVTTTADAEEIDIKWAPKWTTTDIALEAACAGLMLVDMGTTLDQKNHPGMYEQNTILGKHPPEASVIGYFTGAIIIHAAVSHILPKTWRTIWQGVFIGVESYSVIHNFSVGNRITF